MYPATPPTLLSCSTTRPTTFVAFIYCGREVSANQPGTLDKEQISTAWLAYGPIVSPVLLAVLPPFSLSRRPRVPGCPGNPLRLSPGPAHTALSSLSTEIGFRIGIVTHWSVARRTCRGWGACVDIIHTPRKFACTTHHYVPCLQGFGKYSSTTRYIFERSSTNSRPGASLANQETI